MKRNVVLVTGCSTGVGRPTAATLAAAGYEVAATARKPGDLTAYAHGLAVTLRELL